MGLTFIRMVSEGFWKQVTLKINLYDKDANLVNQCKGPEAGWGWCIGGTAKMPVWLEAYEPGEEPRVMRWERCGWGRTLS